MNISGVLKGDRNELTEKVREYLCSTEEELKKKHRSKSSGMEIIRMRTLQVDELLKNLFLSVSSLPDAGNDFSLVALGGYGRMELNIRSDIDLMLLYDRRITKELETIAEKMLYVLWDAGVDMGFSTRGISECIKLAREDIKTKTSLLDMRLLLGSEKLFKDLGEKARKELFTGRALERFIKEKLEEKKLRHEKYGESVYILEPNVKEGEGGLRDCHTARWIFSAKYDGCLSPSETRFLGEDEKRSFNGSIEFLHWIRNELHFESKKKKDQLTFDHQERVSKLLGFKDAEHELGVESFMRQYYLHAGNIKNLTDLVVSRCLHGRKKTIFPMRKKMLDDYYAVKDGFIAAVNDDIFEKKPYLMIKAFEHCQRHRMEIEPHTKDLLLKNIERIDEGFRCSLEAAGSFLKILGGEDVYKILSEMHFLKFLGAYIPEFGSITCKVQHDLYHIYTVDAHSIFAVRELERLKKGHYKKEFPLLSGLLTDIENLEILFLGVLLHDIGKITGKGHAEKGSLMVPAIAKRLGLSDDDTHLLVFLVKNHLLLADTAQYRDLHDEKFIIEFAKKIGDAERLKLLYLLTFADVRAVGGEVWNNWKGALFQELYLKGFGVIERGTFEVEEAALKIPLILRDVKDMLKGEVLEEEVANYFELLPMRYFLSTPLKDISEHVKVTKKLTAETPYILNVKQMRERQYTEFVIATHDVHGLFSMITGVMAANSVNILGAQINTLKNGIALDSLQVTNIFGELVTEEHRLKRIEEDLLNVLTGRVRVERLTERLKPSILDKRIKPRVPTRVTIDNEISDTFTVIDIHTHDRLGLLYKISSTLTRSGLYICIAKITTKGDEASDVFYVRDIFGQKIFNQAKLKNLEDTLYDALKGE